MNDTLYGEGDAPKAPPKPEAPKAPPKRGPAAAAPKPVTKPAAAVVFADIPTGKGERTVIYGPGGIGKTSLALTAEGPVAVVDLDESLAILQAQLPADVLAGVKLVGGTEPDFQTMRDALNAPGWDDIKTIIVDSATKAEELALAWVLKNVRTEKGQEAKRIEDYGFGKGYSHIYEAMLALFADLDRHSRAGRNVIVICHECTTTVPNPGGEDFLRWEPRLQAPAKGKNDVRARAIEWADHLLFIGYDINVSENKAKGHGSRTIYPQELPHCRAKSRTMQDQMVYQRHDASVWRILRGDAE